MKFEGGVIPRKGIEQAFDLRTTQQWRRKADTGLILLRINELFDQDIPWLN